MRRLWLVIVFLFANQPPAFADYLEVHKNAYVYAESNRHSASIAYIEPAKTEGQDYLPLAQSNLENGYYRVEITDPAQTGWIYKSRVRRKIGDIPSVYFSSNEQLPSFDPDKLSIATFNIQFLGHFKKRDNNALADLLLNYDIVVVQELIAPPDDGEYPNGDKYSADPESSAFFDEMEQIGFEYWLSEEDTGPGESNHLSTSATEWFVAFYQPDRVKKALDLPNGFLATDLTNNSNYDRVPYAFSFRSLNDSVDFVLISVHLRPGSRSVDKARRKQELDTIANWIELNSAVEKDHIILGDMNIDDEDELLQSTPLSFVSLNDEVLRTNTLINTKKPNDGAKPYDHVMYNPSHTSELDDEFDVNIVNLISYMKPKWSGNGEYPGSPYNHNLFKQYYSDHHVLDFRLSLLGIDDD